MSIAQSLIALPVVVFLHFCSLAPYLNRVPKPPGTTETHGIAYATGSRNTLDVYLPRPSAKRGPIVVFFYGGGWTSGEKASYRFIGTSLVESGALVVIPDYRLFPEAIFPAFMDDAAEAVAWVLANASRLGADPRKLFLVGHSAGAQIATLLALDPSYLEQVGASTRDVCGVIGLAGLYEFLPLPTENMRTVFGTVTALSRTQPINFVSRDAPPMLLAAGLWDGAVDPENTLHLASALRSAGVQTTVAMYAGISHAAIIDSMAPSLSFLSPARAQALSFIEDLGACAEREKE
jgi:acetyl esterase/lipase